VKYKEGTMHLHRDGFRLVGGIWQSKDNEDIFALSTHGRGDEAIDSGKIIDALITILETIDKQFNSASLNFGADSIYWPLNQDEDKEELNN